MAIKAQGTEVYFLAPPVTGTGPSTVIEIGCVTSFNPGGSPAEQIDITCLADNERSFMRGLRTPGQMSMSVNVDPKDPSHMRLFQLSQDDSVADMMFAVGWSDGEGIAPTVTTNTMTLPPTRTWYTFRGYVSDFPFDFASNSAVTADVSIQRTGPGVWIKKA